MGIKPKDLDFATTATPQQMKDMFVNENVRMINMKGEKHGTITPRINDKENFEVTTLRIDVVTDGRHAEVQFTTDWLLDANRRDLTINSMFLGKVIIFYLLHFLLCSFYLGLDGSLYDYFYGYDDLQKRRVAFVGDAILRIQEDYLRILRYFRFYGRISSEPNVHEESTLKAIKENAHGLGRISGERIWMELKKILEGNFAGDIMEQIISLGIGPYIGLKENCDIKELQNVWSRSKHLKLNAVTLLSSLFKSHDDVVVLHDRLKLSAFDRDLAFFLVEHKDLKLDTKPLLPYQKLVLKAKTKPLDTKLWIIEALKYNNSPLLPEFEKWNIPKFPISGNMLKEQGVDSGKFMGKVIDNLKQYWADNNFDMTSEELLKHLPRVVGMLKEKK